MDCRSGFASGSAGSDGRGPASNFDVHPDGKRFAVLKAPATGETTPVNKVSFIFNFFDEIRRKVPLSRN
jgi:hypothetical protein